MIGECGKRTYFGRPHGYAISHELAMAALPLPTQILARKTTGRDRIVQRNSLDVRSL
jgi:hypothetical protein